MEGIIKFISQPWHWSVSGVGIVIVMFLLIILAKRFGISTSFKTICSAGGAGKRIAYFDYNWKDHNWLLLFIIGAMLGGYIGSTVFASPLPVQISAATISDLAELGINHPSSYSEGAGFLPEELFNFSNLKSPTGLILMVLGGIFIGFGTRWAGGCTSGHAISGLAELQLPSLIAVIGFFMGGLAMTHLIFPLIFN
jgi:uncharacterized membrane protein YedE/YeeE